MSNIERKYAYYDQGVLPTVGESGVTYLTLYSSDAGNIYDGWIYDPEHKVPVSVTERTFGYRHPEFSQYCWDDEVVVDLSNPQAREESEFEQGRITSFNTNVSPYPILLQDIDTSQMTEEERERHATTILFTAIPLVKDAYIHAEVEVQMKMNLSESNTSGAVRVEAFYIVNNESDRTMRPHPINHYTVVNQNEYDILRLLYFNPALKHDVSNYIGVKLICTGGTAEIGISDVREYGDAIITLTSAGLTGDIIYDGQPVSLEIFGLDEVPYGYELDIEDYTVFCEYDNGDIYDVTRLCQFSPEMGTEIITPITTLTAMYQGLTASMDIRLGDVEYIELTGVDKIHGQYTLNINDYTVMAYFENGYSMDVTNECTFSPSMGTTLYSDTTLTATYVASWMTGPNTFTDSLELTAVGVKREYGTGKDIIYTMYDDNYVVISGHISDDYSVAQDSMVFNVPQQRTHNFQYGGTTSHTTRISGTTYTSHTSIYYLMTDSNAKYYFNVNLANFDGSSKATKVEWRCQGKPRGLCLEYLSECTELIGFENMDTSEIVSMENCFKGANSNLDLSFLNNKQFPKLTNLRYAFSECSMKGITSFDSSNVEDMDRAFAGYTGEELPDFFSTMDVSKVKRMSYMFASSSNLKDISKMSTWITTSLERMCAMFLECTDLESIVPMSGWDTRNVVDMSGMCKNCSSLERMDVGDWRTDSMQAGNVTGSDGSEGIKNMFSGCSSLTTPTGISSLISNLPQGSFLTDMFSGSGLHNLINFMGAINQKIASMEYMFYECADLVSAEGASSWNTSNVIRLSYIFGECSNLLDAPLYMENWDTGNVYYITGMLNGVKYTHVTVLDHLENWNHSNMQRDTNAFATPAPNAPGSIGSGTIQNPSNSIVAGRDIKYLPEGASVASRVLTWWPIS